VDQIIQICNRFRKMLHDEEDAVLRACQTRFNNALLEGTVNKAKSIKRGMYNRANADVLRAKMIYAGLKWDWNHHLN